MPREKFNSDNAKIDAVLAGKGNCQLVHGTYVGTGDYGYFKGNTLTFDLRPLLVILTGYYTMLIPGTGGQRTLHPGEQRRQQLLGLYLERECPGVGVCGQP